MTPEIKNLSLSDLSALIGFLNQKEALYTFAGNTKAATAINFQVQDLEDLADEKIRALGIEL